MNFLRDLTCYISGLQVKSDFLEMLSEDRSLSEDSHWRKVKGGFERDPRYRAVTGGSTQREEWFKEYIRSLATSSKVCRGEFVHPCEGCTGVQGLLACLAPP